MAIKPTRKHSLDRQQLYSLTLHYGLSMPSYANTGLELMTTQRLVELLSKNSKKYKFLCLHLTEFPRMTLMRKEVTWFNMAHACKHIRIQSRLYLLRVYSFRENRYSQGLPIAWSLHIKKYERTCCANC